MTSKAQNPTVVQQSTTLSAASLSLRPRDFVETQAGLLFALVAHGTEMQRALGFLRYVRENAGLHKVGTDEANQLLQRQHPEYLFHSPQRDVQLHGVPVDRIATHYKPSDRLTQLLASDACDPFEQTVACAARILGGEQSDMSRMGVTGSVLVAAHHERSDIDLVVYGLEPFARARERLRVAQQQGVVQVLDDSMWRETYLRRGCSLTFPQYLWHERRKLNKCMVEGVKVDLSCVADEPPWSRLRGRKLEQCQIQATVIDDREAFAYPSLFVLDHRSIPQVISYNPTYTGQAVRGEKVEASGWVERLDNGQLRLVVGTTREAVGEYIRVLDV